LAGYDGVVPLDRLTSHVARPIEQRMNQVMRAYWLERVAAHFHDSYAGIPLHKFPEDLRVYEHLLWQSRSDTVIEVGVQNGASQLWFRDRLATLAAYGRIDGVTVIGVDVDLEAARANLARADPRWGDGIKLIEGSIEDPVTVALIYKAVPEKARCFVVDDSAHVYDTTMATLRHLAALVPEDGFLVVEDGCVDVDEMRLSPDWPRGVLPALTDWLATPEGSGFRQRRDLELYGITCHPGGYLQRRTD
jgi:cephalosporin hydroxylase